MRIFKKDNVIKKTDNTVKIEKLLNLRFVEIDNSGREKESNEVNETRDLKTKLKESDAKREESESKLQEAQNKIKELESKLTESVEETKLGRKPAAKKEEPKGE